MAIEIYTRSGTTYQKKELIGYGSCASVFRFIDLRTNKEVAIKIYVYPRVSKNNWRSRLHQAESLLRQEIYLMTSIEHPNLLGCTDIYYRREHKSLDFGIVSELATYDFCTYMREGPIPLEVRKKYMQEFLSGIMFLHQCGYLHCDLKLDNLLYYRNTGRLKLADFGMCYSRTRYKTGDLRLIDIHCSPVSTRAPELLQYSQLLRRDYKDFWATLPSGFKRDPSIRDLYKCECYSIGHVLLELYLWREVEIFETQELWRLNLESRLSWINNKAVFHDPEIEHTLALLLDVNPDTRLSDLGSISWRLDMTGTQLLPVVRSIPLEYKSEVQRGIHYLYVDLVRRRERIYTLGQVLGLYHRILSDDPILIFQVTQVAICCINLIVIKRITCLGEDTAGIENMDQIMEMILQKFVRLNGIIYTRTIDTLTTDSYLAWKSLTYYTEPELMAEFTPSQYLETIPCTNVERIDFHSDLLSYVRTYGELC